MSRVQSIVNALLVVVAAIVLFVVGNFVVREYRYLRHGVATEAIVTSVTNKQLHVEPVDSYGSGGNVVYERTIRYRFSDENGRERAGQDTDTANTPSPWFTGDKITIEFLRTNPDVSRIGIPNWRHYPWKMLVGGLLVAGLIVVVARWWTDRESWFNFVSRLRGDWLAGHRTHRRRRRLMQRPVPEFWRDVLQRNYPAFERLSAPLKDRLFRDMQVFIAEKNWEGCNGLQFNDEMKVTIAAQACRLQLGRDTDYYPNVQTILLYPTAFRAGDEDETETVDATGQAWHRGPVILAWDDVIAGGRNPIDGRNVVYHEFAHQLDFAGNWRDRQQAERWREVMSAEYQQLVDATEMGRATLLDKYGATNPEEFFAVATECFFERPIEMQARHASLFEVMCDFYGEDPSVTSAS
jgi:hypothetical protein